MALPVTHKYVDSGPFWRRFVHGAANEFSVINGKHSHMSKPSSLTFHLQPGKHLENSKCSFMCQRNIANWYNF